MPSTFRYRRNPRMYDRIASTRGMRKTLKRAADRGANNARAIAPEYSGPTYDPNVSRHGEYKDSIYSEINMTPNGWRAEFGATALWWAQVEYGSGSGVGNRDSRGRFRSSNSGRPQGGWSPKTRTLGRALDSLRES